MLSRCFLDFSVGVRASVIGLSQISSFSLHIYMTDGFFVGMTVFDNATLIMIFYLMLKNFHTDLVMMQTCNVQVVQLVLLLSG